MRVQWVQELLESGEGEEGTYCIFSCNNHPAMEVQCGNGEWDNDPDNLTCP